MRVSLESRCDSTSSCAGCCLDEKNARQQPRPFQAGDCRVVSLMHWPSGKSPGFCSDFGGSAYSPTVSVVWLRASAGVEPSDWVLVSAHTSRSVEEPLPLDRKSTRLNSSHRTISYAVFCLKKKT